MLRASIIAFSASSAAGACSAPTRVPATSPTARHAAPPAMHAAAHARGPCTVHQRGSTAARLFCDCEEESACALQTTAGVASS